MIQLNIMLGLLLVLVAGTLLVMIATVRVLQRRLRQARAVERAYEVSLSSAYRALDTIAGMETLNASPASKRMASFARTALPFGYPS
jgi:type II secretory pathway pseudopilin PulG